MDIERRIETAKSQGWQHCHFAKSIRMAIGIAPTSEAAAGCKQVGWEPVYHELPYVAIKCGLNNGTGNLC